MNKVVKKNCCMGHNVFQFLSSLKMNVGNKQKLQQFTPTKKMKVLQFCFFQFIILKLTFQLDLFSRRERSMINNNHAFKRTKKIQLLKVFKVVNLITFTGK